MKFRFESNLNFQLEAINAVAGLFEGAPFVRAEHRILAGVVANRLEILPEQLRENRDRIIKENGIDNAHPTDDWDFSVEMETGTGKTYVYLRTVLELHKRYGLTKFIIVVPSKPVREGVRQALIDTQEHFRDLYRVTPQFFVYDSKKPAMVRQFAQSASLQIMVINTQAFAAADIRKIFQDTDQNGGIPLVEQIAATMPVVIMDEPQEGMGTTNFLEQLQKFNPLLKLRYSATHRDIVNLVYRLTPVDAYNRHLVKVIEVLSVVEKDDQSMVPITFHGIKIGKGAPTASAEVSIRMATGKFVLKDKAIKVGDNLEEKTGNLAYRGWIVENIRKDLSDGKGRIRFSNGKELTEGEKSGRNQEMIFREQIRRTIERHFQKKDLLGPKGIKVLSLFFIDRVANYVEPDGLIRRLFEEEYPAVFRGRYKKTAQDISRVHNGYFAKTGNGEFTDNEAAMEKNADAYNLILEDKKRLLGVDEPVEFLFSHSALGVGWDNPNVFNICTLNQRESVIRKRQEIGRGLRICVGASGERMHDTDDVPEDDRINVLTIVPNVSFDNFAKTYQHELEEDVGAGAGEIKLRNPNAKKTITLDPAKLKETAFDQLWRKISQKTRFETLLNEGALVTGGASVLAKITVPESRVLAQLDRITSFSRAENQAVGFVREYKGDEATRAFSAYATVDIITRLSQEVRLSYLTVQAMVELADCGEQVSRNPVAWLAEAAQRIRRFVDAEIIKVVRYVPTSERYELEEFLKTDTTYKDTVHISNGIYDQVEIDSVTVEKPFAEELGRNTRVRVLLKLPKWYSIPTPYGKHHPDWGVVIEHRTISKSIEENHLFVVETKGKTDIEGLTPEEQGKIICARAHFKALGFKWYVAPVTDKDDFARQAKKCTDLDLL